MNWAVHCTEYLQQREDRDSAAAAAATKTNRNSQCYSQEICDKLQKLNEVAGGKKIIKNASGPEDTK